MMIDGTTDKTEYVENPQDEVHSVNPLDEQEVRQPWAVIRDEQAARVWALKEAKGLLEHREAKAAFAASSVIPAKPEDLILLADYITRGSL